MTRATIRFQFELNDFLPPDQRGREIAYKIKGPVAIKHSIEALGVPHVEVAHILVDGDAVGFFYLVGEGDRLEIFPARQEVDDEPIRSLRPLPSYPARFVVDGHLGQLAKYLRLLGFDTLYQVEIEDWEIAQVSQDQERILLTRDVRLLMRKNIVHGYWLRSKEPAEQIMEVLGRYRLMDTVAPWRRCLRCNGEVHKVTKAEIMDRLEPLTKLHYQEFHVCQECDQIYWKGSHYRPLRKFVQEIMDERV